MEFRKLQWLFPVAAVLHNGEEAIWMPGWAENHIFGLPFHPPGAAELRLVLVLLTVAAFAITYLSDRRGPGSLWAYLVFGYIIAMLANVFLPHVPAAFFFHEYAPGVVTAVVINLPVMSYLAWLAVRDGWVRGPKALAIGLGVPLAMLGLILAVFYDVGWI